MYQTGGIPEDFKISTFIPIPKKKRAKKCSDHRTISIMSHVLELLLVKKSERKNRPISQPDSIWFCSKKRHSRSHSTFQGSHAKSACSEKKNVRDIRLIKNLYWQQSANVRINKKTTSTLCEIQKGVRQECPLSPRLFNLYVEMIA